MSLSTSDIDRIKSSPNTTYYNYKPSNSSKKYIGKSITIVSNIEHILDRYYTEFMNNKLKLYDNKMFNLRNYYLNNNKQLLNLFNNIVQPRSFINKFRKNNTLTNLITLYEIIRNRLDDIQNTIDSSNYSYFYMLVYLSYILKKEYVYLNNHFIHNGNLIDLLLVIQKQILMIAYIFLKNIYLSYNANYSVTEPNLTNISSLKNLSSSNLLSIKPVSSPSSNTSQRNNIQKYAAGIDLYIQFLSMYKQICLLIETFKQYTHSTGNLTQIFIDEIKSMFKDISEKNKLLFREYIKYLGRVEIANSVATGFPYKNTLNTLLKGLYHQGLVW